MRGLRGFLRALALETLLVLLGFCLASWLVVPGLLGTALALWGFGLVLSLRTFLPRPDSTPPRGSADAFEAARSRALALLEQEP